MLRTKSAGCMWSLVTVNLLVPRVFHIFVGSVARERASQRRIHAEESERGPSLEWPLEHPIDSHSRPQPSTPFTPLLLPHRQRAGKPAAERRSVQRDKSDTGRTSSRAHARETAIVDRFQLEDSFNSRVARPPTTSTRKERIRSSSSPVKERRIGEGDLSA